MGLSNRRNPLRRGLGNLSPLPLPLPPSHAASPSLSKYAVLDKNKVQFLKELRSQQMIVHGDVVSQLFATFCAHSICQTKAQFYWTKQKAAGR